MLKSNINGGYTLRIAVGFLILALCFAFSASAATLTVNASGGADYTRIQDAIDNASAGDTILVDSGMYYENVDVNKKLILRGNDTGVGRPVVDAGKNGNAITISAGNSIIDGFKAINSKMDWTYAGIQSKSNFNIIINNIASDNFYGIWLYPQSINNYLSGNNISNNIAGIALEFSSNFNTLTNNIASNNYNGIYLQYSSNNNLTNNIVNLNVNDGIYLYQESNNNTLNGNKASNNMYGIYLDYSSSNNTILDNFFNNTNNFWISGTIGNIWNSTRASGINIIGGSFLGGNFWANPSGTGFSQTCIDGNNDGICDSQYELDGSNIDYLPLAFKSGISDIIGSVATGPMTWNASNFPAFWYEDGISGETLSVNQNDLSGTQRVIDTGNLVYSTAKKVIPYKVYTETGLTVYNGLDASGFRVPDGGYYAKVGWFGKPYVAVNGQAYKLSEIVLEQNSTDFKNLGLNETWNLGNGYNLTLIALDKTVPPWQAAFNLSNKSGTIDQSFFKEGDVYTYLKRNLAGESDVPFFVTYIDNISENSVRLKYTWLISDNVTIFDGTQTFGNMEFVSATSNGLSLSNKNPITLTRGSTINLLDDIYLRVNDNQSLEYYPVMRAIYPLPPSSLSMIINNGDAYTNSTSVTLNLSALNANEMSFSNDNISWSTWESFATSKLWDIASGEGIKTIYFKARNTNGETAPVNGTIILDTTAPIVNIISPINGTVVNTQNVMFTGNVSDNYGITTECIEYLSGMGGGMGCGGPINKTYFEFNRNITLQEGNNLIRFIYIDVAQNIGSASINVTRFISPGSPYLLSIIINNNDTTTRSTAVILSISAINATEMSFSNDNISWSPWELYTTTKAWNITLGDGLKTVYYKAKNSAGEAEPVSDTIIFDTTKPSIIGNIPIGSDIPLSAQINVAFSEAMNRTSAEGAFSTIPATNGKFNWNGSTMSYTPGLNLAASTTYNVTVGTGAKDLAGNNLESSYSWQFITGSPFLNWKFISVPYELENSSVAHVLQGIEYESLFAWDPIGKEWISPVTNFKPLQGYLIKMNTSQTITNLEKKKGVYIPPSRDLIRGWNLIGTNGTNPLPAETMLQSIDDNYYSIWNFNVSTQSYDKIGVNGKSGNIDETHVGTDVFMMQPEESYWVFATANTSFRP